MPDGGQIPWGPVRSVLEESFSYGSVKLIVAAAGVDMGRLVAAHNKVDLMVVLDRLHGEMEPEEKSRFVAFIVEEILARTQERQPEVKERLNYVLSRVGWSLVQARVLPIELIDHTELQETPEEARDDLIKAATRFRDGDLSGAVSAACGAVDSVTHDIYQKKNLGDPGTAAFQERTTRSLEASGVLAKTESDLISIGWDADKARRLCQNLRGSLNQAANVMQALRSNMGDVHGTKEILKGLVFDSLQWAKLIVRLLKEV